MHRLTLEYLYRNVEITHKTKSGISQVLNTSTGERNECYFSRNVYDFTALALSKPERARMVKSLTLSKKTCRIDHPSREKLHDGIIVAVRQAQWSPTDGSRQLQEIKGGQVIEALVAVLLPYLPQLERLEFLFSHRNPDFIHYYDRMLASILSQSGNLPETAFSRLRHLTAPQLYHAQKNIPRFPVRLGIWPHQLAYFLKLPSMRSIEGCLRVYHDEAHKPPSYDGLDSLGSASSPVESLALESRSFLYAREVVKKAVLACRKLRKLELKVLRGFFIGEEFACLVAATMQASHSLETLSLRYTSGEDTYDSYIRNSTERYTISLVDFPNLRNVTLGVFFLFSGKLLKDTTLGEGHLRSEHGETVLKRLPAQIVSLRIVVCNGEEAVPIFANVEAILWQKRDGQFPRLVSIFVEYLTPKYRKLGPGQALLGDYGKSEASPYLALKKLAESLFVDFEVIPNEAEFRGEVD